MAAIAAIAFAGAASAAEPPPPTPLVVFYAPADLGPARAAGEARWPARPSGTARRWPISRRPTSRPPRPRSSCDEPSRRTRTSATPRRWPARRRARRGDGDRSSGPVRQRAVGPAALPRAGRRRAGRRRARVGRLHACRLVNPSRQLDPVRFPPRVIETFARAVEAVTAGPPATLAVELAPGCQSGRRARGGGQPSYHRARRALRPRPLRRASPHGERILVADAHHRLAPALVAVAPPAADAIRAAARQRGPGRAVGGTSVELAPAAPRRSPCACSTPRPRARAHPLADTAAAPTRRAGGRRAPPAGAGGAAARATRPARRTPWYAAPGCGAWSAPPPPARCCSPSPSNSGAPTSFEVRPAGNYP